MAALTYLQMQQHLAALTGLSGTDATTRYKLYLNLSGRRIWSMFSWPERRAQEDIILLAPYVTGTATLTNASAAVTGQSTVWTSSHTGFKIALGYGSPFYRFTQTAGTTGTITPSAGYQQTTSTAGAYVLYQDEYNLAAACAVTEDLELDYNGWQGRINLVPARMLDGAAYVAPWSGIPTTACETVPTTAGTKRIRVYPIPDQNYVLHHRYLKTYTDLSDDSGVTALNLNLEGLLLDGALMYAQQYAGRDPFMSEAVFEAKVRQAWIQQMEVEPIVTFRRTFDSSIGADSRILDLRNIAT